ncbi:hypothetical protein M514_19842 [Trichuris suis]|uniref:Uncharacterized protein n=1 Tax=Trichuris suis TaxID=68888 RepID=A0A085NER9_9BILA|nr:hypothetical protein M514_19842 [Trichuris suis]
MNIIALGPPDSVSVKDVGFNVECEHSMDLLSVSCLRTIFVKFIENSTHLNLNGTKMDFKDNSHDGFQWNKSEPQ